ncbi:hypothetical protein CYMTET_55284 [Cymbomonas tetramitiformis]|uniref:Uncharacterized protein n=1 Tax=Cymbomonas tetramitiformis TaxID=36881 RepID=A0AAE0BF45_9CHLO|nr:hypothetical protein CYMTET_55284 [Cymbomonas tetramitiformis]
MFGMTAHGSGDASIFSQKRLSIINFSSLDMSDVNAKFNKCADVNGMITDAKVSEFLTLVHKGRAPDDLETRVIKTALGKPGPYSWENFYRALDTLRGHCEPPPSPCQYTSGELFRGHLRKHRRRDVPYSEEYGDPLLESHKYGWTSDVNPDIPSPIEHRTVSTELSHYQDCITKHENGRSIQSEFCEYGNNRLNTQVIHGAPSGSQHPPF